MFFNLELVRWVDWVKRSKWVRPQLVMFTVVNTYQVCWVDLLTLVLFRCKCDVIISYFAGGVKVRTGNLV